MYRAGIGKGGPRTPRGRRRARENLKLGGEANVEHGLYQRTFAPRCAICPDKDCPERAEQGDCAHVGPLMEQIAEDVGKQSHVEDVDAPLVREYAVCAGQCLWCDIIVRHRGMIAGDCTDALSLKPIIEARGKIANRMLALAQALVITPEARAKHELDKSVAKELDVRAAMEEAQRRVKG